MSVKKAASTRSRVCLALGLVFSLATQMSAAWDRGEFETFALLPAGSANPEALAVDARGSIYASTFGGEIHQFSRRGDIVHSIKVAPSSGTLLDLAFHPFTGALLVVDLGAQQILEVDPASGAATVFSTIPGGPSAGPNALTFDAYGNVYVSDSFQGIVWRIGSHGGVAQAWVSDDLLKPSGFPPFGANGLGFNKAESVLYVANTANDAIIAVPVDVNGVAQKPAILAEGVNGPDGILVDKNDRIWIAANMSNEIVVLNAKGKAVKVMGDFAGVKKGIVQGLLFPSDLVKRGNKIYVVNFALDVTAQGLAPTITTDYTKKIKRHSIAVLKLEHKRDRGNR